MLPFPRLVEYANILPPNTVLLDIDFSTQTIGDNFIRDNAGAQFSTIGTAGSVQYDPQLGQNVFKFSGAGYYVTPPIISGSKLDLTNRSFEVVIQFKTNRTSVMEGLWETGNYSSQRIPGITCALNQFPSTYFQYFLDSGETYNRVLMNGTNHMSWETMTFTYIKNSGITVKSSYYNNTQTFPLYPYGIGYKLSIGGSYVSAEVGGQPYYFGGSLAKLKITEIK
ncbi:virion structural protein [Pectobacterium phage vB_PcaM_CBB]|uniref:Structural protein n=1 Tax=Pectobacterium phage vB_PcaM_CBB TaxID=2772511 RepID=A0A1L2CVQ8_9CAUD|nr:virion structural protein [Pectobacterium phage vB_PcaM_CBB]AMM44112.1 structural protein [Pectobacterium phage vB_PcaM_CBB]